MPRLPSPHYEIREAARVLGLQIAVLKASTSREIEAAFSTLVPDRADALFVAPDSFFTGRPVQFATLAAHHRVPAAYTQRAFGPSAKIEVPNSIQLLADKLIE